jgi:hypothetical protein
MVDMGVVNKETSDKINELFGCVTGLANAVNFIEYTNLYDKPIEDWEKEFKKKRFAEGILWWREVRNKRDFITKIGNVVMTNKFKIRHPIDGSYHYVETLEEARQCIHDMANTVFEFIKIEGEAEITNDVGGGTMWTPIVYQIKNDITVTIPNKPNL